MNLVTVDEAKCNRDGLCAKACPAAIIHQEDEKSFPMAAAEREQMCIQCGHCVAVCPSGALSHADMNVTACAPIKKDLACSIDQVEQFFRSRRSIRYYKSEAAPREVISKLIDLSRYAPTAHNDQAVEWIVISGQNEVKKYAGLAIDYFRHLLQEDPEKAKQKYLDLIVFAWDMGFDAVCRSAPHLIIAHAAKNAIFSQYYPTDCATALAYMELAAPLLGLGTCWNGMLLSAIDEWKPLQEALSVPEQNRCFGALMAGHPRLKYRRLPTRREPKISWL